MRYKERGVAVTTQQEQFDSPGKAFDGSYKPAMKYVGLALMLSWHYTLWFVPEAFFPTPLLSDGITYSWLIMLGASVLTLLLTPTILGRRRYLSSHHWLLWAIPVVLAAGTLYLTLVAFTLESPTSAYAVSVIIGIGSGLYWILWGEFFAKIKANFSIHHIGPVVAVTLLISLTLATLLPPPFSSIFASLLPLISGFALTGASKCNQEASFPALLPASTTKGGIKSMIIVCLISFMASIACYFLVAIIPWELLPTLDKSFTFGVMGGAILMLIITIACKASRQKYNIFKMLPWLLILIVIAFALFLADSVLYFAAFILALAVSSVFELLLVMYFGILTSKGYAAPALAFGLSGGFIRAGIALGNALAIYYEKHPGLSEAITPETALVLICILVALVIPLVRQEYSIAKLTSDPPSESDLEVRCTAVSQEFKLSAREAEIVILMARGYTADNIAKKLVISPYTVNTHIRHIYEKMSIHKRSELLNYINMHKTDY